MVVIVFELISNGDLFQPHLKYTLTFFHKQQIASQWSLQLIFRMHNNDPTPEGVENLWWKIEIFFCGLNAY
jgi:hypothetical protein